jgi:hypothetical protein
VCHPLLIREMLFLVRLRPANSPQISQSLLGTGLRNPCAAEMPEAFASISSLAILKRAQFHSIRGTIAY